VTHSLMRRCMPVFPTQKRWWRTPPPLLRWENGHTPAHERVRHVHSRTASRATMSSGSHRPSISWKRVIRCVYPRPSVAPVVGVGQSRLCIASAGRFRLVTSAWRSRLMMEAMTNFASSGSLWLGAARVRQHLDCPANLIRTLRSYVLKSCRLCDVYLVAAGQAHRPGPGVPPNSSPAGGAVVLR